MSQENHLSTFYVTHKTGWWAKRWLIGAVGCGRGPRPPVGWLRGRQRPALVRGVTAEPAVGGVRNHRIDRSTESAGLAPRPVLRKQGPWQQRIAEDDPAIFVDQQNADDETGESVGSALAMERVVRAGEHAVEMPIPAGELLERPGAAWQTARGFRLCRLGAEVQARF